jgi:hypothetical protein
MKITTGAGELQEGLFGQVILWTFEVLPYLHSRGIFPAWDIKSRLYGAAPDYTVVPGVLDLAYEPPRDTAEVSLDTLRHKHVRVLGGDWERLHDLWYSYFAIPKRVLEAADDIALPSGTLGIHYRGNDKNAASWDTNPVSHQDFLTLINGFLREHPEVKSIFLATDESSFVAAARRALPTHVKVINLGPVQFHKAQTDTNGTGERALLDCVLLSRCRYVLKCSSALSAFAKVLNPKLDAYRIAASKLFADIPYFPEAYIPRWSSTDPECAAILQRLFANDWLENDQAKRKFGASFAFRRRYSPGTRLTHKLRGLASRIVRRVKRIVW